MTNAEMDAIAENIIRRHIAERHPGQECCEDPASGKCYALVADQLREEIARLTMTEPRSWELPAEPGQEVTAVRNDAGAVWDRDGRGWRFRTRSRTSGVHGSWTTWLALIREEQRLTDATTHAEEDQ